MASKTHRNKRAIIATITALHESRPAEIQAALGPAWEGEAKRVELQQDLAWLTKKHLIERPLYGIYTPSRNPGFHSIDNRDGMEELIADFLLEYGCVAPTGDIHKAVYDRPKGFKDRDYNYQCVTSTLKESPRFFQDFGRGFWNLSTETREMSPLPGRWAAMDIKKGRANGERGSFDTWLEQRDAFFFTVGSAFSDASGDFSTADVAQVAAVHEALQIMGGKAPGAKGEAREAFRKKLEYQQRECGASDPYLLAQALEDAGEGWVEYLYVMFLRGDARLHLVAPAGFYRSCADVFGVCPARLSRGEISRIGGEG